MIFIDLEVPRQGIEIINLAKNASLTLYANYTGHLSWNSSECENYVRMWPKLPIGVELEGPL